MATPAVAELKHQIALLNEYNTSSELGVLLCSMLFGVFVVQLYLYHTTKRADSLGLRLLVVWVSLVETAHTVLLWFYFVQTGRRSRFNPLAAIELSPALVFVYFTSALMGATVQSYYACRLYRFSSSLPLAALPLAGSLARLGLAVAGAVVSFHPGAATILEFMDRFGWCMRGVFVASVAVDVWNTAALCIILARRRSGQLKATAAVIDRLIMWAVETGLVTSALAILMLVFAEGQAGANRLNARDGMRQTLYSTRQWHSAGSASQGRTTATFSFGPSPAEPNEQTKDKDGQNDQQQQQNSQARVSTQSSRIQFETKHHDADGKDEWERGGYAI
ncbi:hypothetical protein AURDEDRAFT_124865 [Auricularia subglabra TFB-10046 SS5]|nr:hypothetical protein AURDEDRAFT_124865 [Auricularia subglabra TFB-10046 SS5]